jgi:hypothetical protein
MDQRQKAENPRLPWQSWVSGNFFKPGLESLLHDAEGAVHAPAGHMSQTALGANNLNGRHQLHGGKKQDVCVFVKISIVLQK